MTHACFQRLNPKCDELLSNFVALWFQCGAAVRPAPRPYAKAKLMHGTAIRCLQAWAAHVLEKQRLEALCQAVAFRIMSMAAYAALVRWKEHTTQAGPTDKMTRLLTHQFPPFPAACLEE